jgi:hypothetical protein
MKLNKLKKEVARLKGLLEVERVRVSVLEREIQLMRYQESAMAALFRGTQPTIEGRIAHAKMTSRHH